MKNEVKKSNSCPKCGGRLIAGPTVDNNWPPLFSAQCEKCKKIYHSYHPIGTPEDNSLPETMWECKSTFTDADGNTRPLTLQDLEDFWENK